MLIIAAPTAFMLLCFRRVVHVSVPFCVVVEFSFLLHSLFSKFDILQEQNCSSVCLSINAHV